MKNIAVTGSFASGKSFVLNCLKEMGYKIFSCDDYVKKIYENIDLQNLVVSKIKGMSFFSKKTLLEIIYNDFESKKILESIIHPRVREGIKAFEELNKNQKLIFTEVPLLFESNFDRYFSYSICVYCFEETRLERAKQRKGYDIEMLKKINLVQFSQEDKKKKSDFVVNSEQSVEEINLILKNIIEKVK